MELATYVVNKLNRPRTRIATILLRDQRASGWFVSCSMQILERLSIDETTKRTGSFRHAASKQATDLIHQPAFELLIDASSDPPCVAPAPTTV